jgi:hypothetical protein
MARSFLTAINLNQNQIQNPQLHQLAAAPSSPVAGQIYYDTVKLGAFVYNGTSWQPTDASLSTIIPVSAIPAFASTVLGYHLNQFASPTASVAMNGQQITGLATSQSATGQAASWDFVTGRALNTIAAAAPNSANVAMNSYNFTGLAAPTAAGQAAEYAWTLSRPLSSFTGTMAGNLVMGGYQITGLGTPSAAGQAATYDWVLARPVNSFAAATGALAMGGNQITGLNTVQTTSGQAASYDFVIAQIQAAAAGIASKPPVMCIATSNITLSGLQTLDSYTTLAADRVLVTGQTTATQNGVYNAASGAWTRVTDDGSAPGEIEPGAMWLIVNGTVYGGSQWRCSTTGTITIGTTSITIVQFASASLYSAGNGITLTGTAFSVNAASSVGSSGPGGGLVVSGSGVAIDTTVVARKYSGTIGDGTTTQIVVTHNLNTQDVVMSCRLASTPYSVVDCDMAATSTTTATFGFAVAPVASSLRVTVLG